MSNQTPLNPDSIIGLPRQPHQYLQNVVGFVSNYDVNNRKPDRNVTSAELPARLVSSDSPSSGSDDDKDEARTHDHVRPYQDNVMLFQSIFASPHPSSPSLSSSSSSDSESEIPENFDDEVKQRQLKQQRKYRRNLKKQLQERRQIQLQDRRRTIIDADLGLVSRPPSSKELSRCTSKKVHRAITNFCKLSIARTIGKIMQQGANIDTAKALCDESVHKIIAKNLKRHVLFASYKVHCRNVWTTYLNDVQFVVDKEYDVIRLLFKADSLCILPHFTSCTEAKNFFETLLRYLSNLSDDLTNLNTMVNHFLVASSSPGQKKSWLRRLPQAYEYQARQQPEPVHVVRSIWDLASSGGVIPSDWDQFDRLLEERNHVATDILNVIDSQIQVAAITSESEPDFLKDHDFIMQDDSIVEEWTINEESFGINTKEMATAAAAVSVNAYLLSTSDAEELCHESYLQQKIV